MTDWQSLLRQELSSLGLSVREDQEAQLCVYLKLLERWNRSVNLTSLNPQERVRRLVAEPMWAVRRLEPSGRYLDIGSGNGSPAVAWCVVQAFAGAELVESRERRAVFLNVLVRKMKIRGVHLQRGRFEQVSRHLQRPDWATLQGVRLDADLLQSIRRLNPEVRVVWLTRGPELPEPPARRIRVPGSAREVLVFEGAAGT